MKRVLLAALAALVLTSCNSFNNWSFGVGAPTATPVASAAGAARPLPLLAVQTDGEMLCPMFTAPEINPIPPLPLAELARVPQNDPGQIDAIQQRHIEDLRAHIREERRILRAAFERYAEECRARQRKPSR